MKKVDIKKKINRTFLKKNLLENKKTKIVIIKRHLIKFY